MGNIVRFLIPIGVYLLVLGLLYSKRLEKWMVSVYVKVQSKTREKMERVKGSVGD